MAERHFVATGYVVRDGKTLLLRHKKLGLWLPPGGHIDENELPCDAALREIREETGLEAEIVSERRAPDPQAPGVRYLHVPNHVQLEDIPNHPQHIDLIYFCRAARGEPKFSAEESTEMRWHSIEELRGAHVRDEVRETGTAAIEWVSARERSEVPR